MGAGKTTVGTELSQMLDCPLIDVDALIEARSQSDIPGLFERVGEQGFRKEERDALLSIDASVPAVITTGGGAVIHNQDILPDMGWVVWLQVSADESWARCQSDSNRPLAEQKAAFFQRWEDRLPLYESLASFSISTDGPSATYIAEEILAAYNRAHDETN